MGAMCGSSSNKIQDQPAAEMKGNENYKVDVDAVIEEYTAFANNPVHTKFFTKLPSDKEHAIERMNYTEELLRFVPEKLWGAFSGGGCHFNREQKLDTAHRIQKGQTIVDFGSGLGGDCLIAAGLVGKEGKVVGLDFTPRMLEKGKEIAETQDATNVSFVEQQLDAPFPQFNFTGTVDRVISNGVFNLCEDKLQAFKNAFDLLRPGGVIVYSDFIILPDGWQPAEGEVEVVSHDDDKASWIDWVAGCVTIAENKKFLTDAGFVDASLLGWNNCYTSRATRGGVMCASKPAAE